MGASGFETRVPAVGLVIACICGCPNEQPAVGTATEGSTAGDSTSQLPQTSATTEEPDHEPIPTTTFEDPTTDQGSGGDEGATTGAPLSGCGDGVVVAGEECDLGIANNRDDGACTQACKLAACGDGLVYAGQEACDLGEQNNDSVYGGCTVTCERGPRCGDEVLQGPEECDLGPEEGGGVNEHGVECTGCRLKARLVFVTSGEVNGKIGGLALADKLCQDAALAAGLDNSAGFLAWLSDADDAAKDRFAGTEEIGRPFVQRNGVPLALDLDTLIEDGPSGGIVVTESGDPLYGVRVWTNTAFDGGSFDAMTHCAGWTSDSLQLFGRAGKNWVSPEDPDDYAAWVMLKGWTSQTTWFCFDKAHLYCFEL